MAEEDETFIREVMYIMIGWLIATVIAGVLLVVFRDSFTGIFTLAGLF